MCLLILCLFQDPAKFSPSSLNDTLEWVVQNRTKAAVDRKGREQAAEELATAKKQKVKWQMTVKSNGLRDIELQPNYKKGAFTLRATPTKKISNTGVEDVKKGDTIQVEAEITELQIDPDTVTYWLKVSRVSKVEKED